MTVAELIARLKTLDQTLTVYKEIEEAGITCFVPVRNSGETRLSDELGFTVLADEDNSDPSGIYDAIVIR